MLRPTRISRLFLFLFTILLTASKTLFARDWPSEDANLNYRIIGFTFPKAFKATAYTLQIARGRHNNEVDFLRNIIVTQNSKESKIKAEVNDFDMIYTWRIVYHCDKGDVNGEFRHFRTGRLPDENEWLEVTINENKHPEAFVFLDGSKVIYDMTGRPVWFLPLIDGVVVPSRDFKLTKQGTITFVSGTNIIEVNYDGQVLWRQPVAPNDKESGRSNRFHHEFLKLSNGHYLGMSESVVKSKTEKVSALSNQKSKIPQSGGAINKNFGALIEYDRNGNIVWSWDATDYFNKSDLSTLIFGGKDTDIDVHENAFCFDEHDKVIYVGFRNISRIVKLKYPEKKILAVYKGGRANPGSSGNGLFNEQHAISLTRSGNLCVFSNNTGLSGGMPEAKIFREKKGSQSGLEEIWNYHCTSEDSINTTFKQGGNFMELRDGCFLVCMGGSYGKTFILDKNKHIQWSATPKRRIKSGDKPFEFVTEYRARLIESIAEFDRMLWNTEEPATPQLTFNQ